RACGHAVRPRRGGVAGAGVRPTAAARSPRLGASRRDRAARGGLPIMVWTGVIERRRALARTTGRAIAPVGLHRWFTWRRALLGGVGAFGTLGVGTAIYMGMRLLGIGPVGTLVASGVLAARDRLVLAEL